MGAAPLDAQVLELLKAKDFEALWSLPDRRTSVKVRLELETFLTQELKVARLPRLVELFEQCAAHGPRRSESLAVAAFTERLQDPHRRKETLVALSGLIRRLPANGSLEVLLTRYDAVPVDVLRQRVRSRTGACHAIFGLVRAGDLDWLEDRVRAKELDESELASLFSASEDSREHAKPRRRQSRDMARRLVRCAREMKDATLMRLVLQHFEVERELAEEALRYDEPALRAALMRHAHRLRDPTSVLRAGLRHPRPEVRRAALRALSKRPLPEALPDIERLVDDPDPYDERYNTEPISFLAKRLLPQLKG